MKKTKKFLFGFLFVSLFPFGYLCLHPVYGHNENGPNVNIRQEKAQREIITTPTFSIDEECWPVKPMQPGDIRDVNLILESRRSHEYYLFHFDNFFLEKIDIPVNDGMFNRRFWRSPDGKRFATILRDNHLFLYENGEGRIFGLPDDNLYEVRFLDDGRIYIGRGRFEYQLKGVSAKNVEYKDRFYLLDPETGIVIYKSVYLPYLYFLRGQFIPLQYSSDMKYVVYLTYLTDPAYDIRVMDVESGELILSKIDIGKLKKAPDMVPGWIPGTHDLSIIFWEEGDYKKENYYRIDLNGKVEKITEFENTQLLTSYHDFMTFPVWSADGQFLVFDTFLGLGKGINSYFYDAKSGIINRVCFADDEIKLNPDIGYTNNPSYLYANTTQMECLERCNSEGAVINYTFTNYIIEVASKTMYEYPVLVIEEAMRKETGSNEYHSLGLVGDID